MAGNRPADWHVLDLDKDPTPGDPDRVRNLAKNLHDFADDVSKVLRDIKGMAGEDAILTWAGKTAESFTAEFEDAPGKLKKLKKSYEMAGDALSTYWPELERAQALADKALVKGREAQGDLSSAQTRLTSADSWMDKAGKEADKYKDDDGGSKSKDVPKPDPDKVKAATRNATSAEKAQTAAKSDVSAAKSNLDAAKKMAEDARKMREDAAGTAKKKLEDASDAGIQNRKWWEEVGDWVTDNWDTIVAVCKVVVAVLGIIAMIIGGPILGAIVLIAALVVLADTLNKYANGEAGLLDVAFAALDCIPGMKGLTSLRGLAKGMMGLKAGMKGLALGAKGLGKGARAMGRQVKKLFTCGDPIDMATGDMVMSATDVELSGVLPLVLERHYRTSVNNGRLFGQSWTSTLDQRLRLDATGALLATADGMILVYPVPEQDVPVLPVEGPAWPLSWDGHPGGTLTVEQPEVGLSLHFRPLQGGSPDELPLAVISDRNDNTIGVTYDADGMPDEVTHHGGYRVGVTCADGRVTELALRSHPEQPTLIRYGYDEHGRLAEVYDSSGQPQKLFHDDQHRINGWEDRNGAWYRYEYDAGGRCVATRGVDGLLNNTFDYDDEAHVTTVVDALGFSTRFQFNDSYQLVAETDPLGNTVRQEWDHRDQMLSWTDALGRTLRMERDGMGNLTVVHLPDGATSRVSYNDLNLPEEQTSYDGSVVRQEWDERGNCTSLTEADGATTRFTRDGTGALTSVTDALGAVSRFTNNEAGQQLTATDPLGAVTRYEYDSFGRQTAVGDPLGATTRLLWTVEGQMAARTHPDGSIESWTYDGEDNWLTHTDALGQVTRHTYGAFGLLASRTTPDGARYTFTHDAELRLIQVMGPAGLAWDYAYDAASRLTSESDFDGRTIAYEYDAAGQLLSRTNAVGQTTTFTYDAVGNQVEKCVDGVTTVYMHDAASRVLRAVSPDATLTYTYDQVGRKTTEAIDGRALTTSYDVLSRPVRRTTPAGATSTYRYDTAGRRTMLTASGHTLTSAYDDLGREVARGIGGTGTSLALSWDAEGRLTGQMLTGPGSSPPHLRRAYAYRADGNAISMDDFATGRREFDLDTMGHVTAVRADGWSESYAYDASGNQTRATWPDRFHGADARGDRSYTGSRVKRAGSVHYEYDGAGRVVLRRKTRLSRKPDIWRYSWDGEDRLTAVTTPDGTRWRYAYDSLGRRVAKRRLAADGESVIEEIRFVWDGPHLVEQTTWPSSSTDESTTITWDRDGLIPVAQTVRTTMDGAPQGGATSGDIDERFFAIVTDLVGAPTELVDEEGIVAWRSDTTLWGLTTWSADARTSTPLRFPGQYFDPETELHYNNLRHYDPTTATYISPDPLGLDAGPNARAYVANPQRWTDYLGLLCNSAILGKNLAADGRPVLPGQAAAHIVPSGIKRPKSLAVDSRNLLKRYNVDINDAANGIPLGHAKPHNFTHRDKFLIRLNQHLVATERIGLAQGHSVAKIGDSIRQELRSIGKQVQHELSPSQMVNGKPSPTATWTRLTP
ncbi:DUF6531 domain-containing protein [Streptomyces rectiviolaceus]|uniref:Type IV secretion protein Rhs n=1 Tax=Streptomyces rectiviolaceus TaxID=332591 RepID=A0ABP6MCZ2_9ACTN